MSLRNNTSPSLSAPADQSRFFQGRKDHMKLGNSGERERPTYVDFNHQPNKLQCTLVVNIKFDEWILEKAN